MRYSELRISASQPLLAEKWLRIRPTLRNAQLANPRASNAVNSPNTHEGVVNRSKTRQLKSPGLSERSEKLTGARRTAASSAEAKPIKELERERRRKVKALVAADAWAACEELGINERTLQRWHRRPATAAVPKTTPRIALAAQQRQHVHPRASAFVTIPRAKPCRRQSPVSRCLSTTSFPAYVVRDALGRFGDVDDRIGRETHGVDAFASQPQR